MRVLLPLTPLLLWGCGGASADEAGADFVPATAKVVTVSAKCALKPSAGGTEAQADDGKATAGGDCNEIIGKSRAYEHRSSTLVRQLEITYAYTHPKDHAFHQGKGEREQPVELPVPRAGDTIDVLVHPEEADTSRLPDATAS